MRLCFFFSFVINENIELTQAHSIQAIHIKPDKKQEKHSKFKQQYVKQKYSFL